MSFPDVSLEDDRWEFDTVRASLSLESSGEDTRDVKLLGAVEDPSSTLSTVRPQAASKVPVTLRMLFDTEPDSPDIFRSAVPGVSRGDVSQIPPIAQSPVHNRTMGRAVEDHTVDDLQTAKPSDFVFPPRTTTGRNKGNELFVEAKLEDKGKDKLHFSKVLRKERLPPLGPGIPVGSAPVPRDPVSGTSSDYPPLSDEESSSIPEFDQKSSVTAEPLLFPELSTPITTMSPLSISEQRMKNRKRSQSSAAETSSSTLRDRNFAASGDFQFHRSSDMPTTESPVLSSFTDAQAHLQRRRSPAHLKSISASSASSGTHQMSQSLDASSLPRHAETFETVLTSPLITRARSATAASDSPYPIALSRQASISRLATLGSIEVNSTTPVPLRPFARRDDRSGSPTDTHTVPGLKDVLKVCQRVLMRQSRN